MVRIGGARHGIRVGRLAPPEGFGPFAGEPRPIGALSLMVAGRLLKFQEALT